jgi:deoxyribodipyrimidine photolyase
LEGEKYDPNGEYVKRWLPELQHVPSDFIHVPWRMNDAQQSECKVHLGIDYPQPFLDPAIGEERRKGRVLKRDRIRDSKLLGRVGKNRPYARKIFR